MTEQPLDLRRLVAVIWRRRLAFLACVGMGLVAAAGFSFASRPPFSARALVLLPASPLDSTGAPTRDVQTQVRIASSTDVLQLASPKLHPPVPVTTMRKNVHVTAPTPDILQFSARASSRTGAMELADQVAQSYVTYAKQGASELLGGVIDTLKTRAQALSTMATRLQTQIDTGTAQLATLPPESAAAAAVAARLDSLHAQQTDTATQLLDINGQIDDAQLNSAVASSGTRILQRAAGASSSALRAGLRNGGIGLLVGLLAGGALALALDSRDRMLRRRDEIAAAAGVPTIASITARAPRDTEGWVSLLARYEPGADESWSLRRTLRQLLAAEDTVPVRTAVVLFDGDTDAIAVPLQLAAFSARAGIRTVLIADVGAQHLPELRDPRRSSGADRDAVLPNLWLFDSRRARPRSDRFSVQLEIRVVVSDGVELVGAGPKRDLATTVLAVSSGFATAEIVAALASNLNEAGRPLFGVIVANPAANDPTSGRAVVPVRDAPAPLAPAPVTRPAPELAVSGDPTMTGAPRDLLYAPGDRLVSLHDVMVALVRWRRRLAGLMAVGIVFGIAVSVVVPHPRSATTALLLQYPTDADPSRAIATDLSLLQTRAVADSARRSLHLDQPADAFERTYRGTILSDSVLQITVRAPDGVEAQRRGNALSRAFLAFRKQTYEFQLSVVDNVLQRRAVALNNEIAATNARIARFDPNAAKSADPAATTLSDLLTQRASQTNDVAQIENEIQGNVLATATVVDGSRVIDPARTKPVSRARTLLVNIATGLVAALALGAGAVALVTVVSTRVRRRSDVAAALRAPVLLSVGAVRPGRWQRVPLLASTLRRLPNARRVEVANNLALIVRHLHSLQTSAATEPPALVVVGVGGVDVAAVASRLLVERLAEDGHRVVLVNESGKPFAGAATEARADDGDPSAALLRGARSVDADGVVVVAALDPAKGAEHLREWASDAVVIVTAGRSTATTLDSNAVMIRAAGLRLRSVVLVGSDRDDDTLGTFDESRPPATREPAAGRAPGPASPACST